MPETVLVTGGTGFIASWCIAELLRRGYAVRTTVRDASKESRVRAAVGLKLYHADLTRDEGWDAALAGCDYVLHIASPLGGGPNDGKEAFLAPARDGTLRVLQAAVKADVKRVVMTSAAAAARPPLESNRMSDETVWSDPDDPQFDAYRLSKILAERAAWDFMTRQGNRTEFTTVLPGAVFGPVLSTDNLGSVKIIQGLLKGQPKALPRIGFWVVDVRDLADLHIKAMTSPAAAGQRFIAAGEFMWMQDIANTLRLQLGSAAANVPTRHLPNLVVRLLLPFMPNLKGLAPLLGRRFPLTSQKARTVLGFAPRPAATTVVDCAKSL
jgi:dihydroflavonol-4-reductase